MKGMSILSFLRRILRRPGNDRGEGMLGTIVGLAVAAIVIGVPVAVLIMGSNSSNASSQLQSQDSSLTTVLNRASQNIQVADRVLYASPTEMVVLGTQSMLTPNNKGEYSLAAESTEAADPVATRWVVKDGVFYVQAWTNPPSEYVHNSWRPLDGSGEKPAGQTPGIALAKDVKSGAIFTYYNRENAVIPPEGGALPAAVLPDITLAKISIGASVLESGKVANETMVALRNAQGPAGEYSPQAACPALTVSANSAGLPKLTWTAVPGASSYVIKRGDAVAATPDSTVREWIDTTATNGRLVNYKVLSVVGGVTSDCNGSPFRSPVVAPTPVISVLPASRDNSAWTASGLTKPRIVLDWEPVNNASGYELYRRDVDPATGTATGGFAHVELSEEDLANTSFTWDDSGWGKRYEWYLQVYSRAGGTGDSARVQTLTNPAAPTNVKAKAAYGVGDKAGTHGTNTITWNAVPTASKYEVWRYNSGKSGAASKVAEVADTKAVVTAEYGSEFSYYVVAVNSGPRGSNAAGVTVTAERTGAPPESVAEKKSSVVTQLQYPPVPAVKPLGAGADNSRDLDGQNRINWAAARSADGYFMSRRAPGADVQECLTGTCEVASGGGVRATSFTEAAPQASKLMYRVRAYNRTGLSRDWSAEVSLTQRPAAPELVVTRHPSLNDETSNFRVAQNADAGNSEAGKFCASSTKECQYELYRMEDPGYVPGAKVVTTTGNGATNIAWDNVSNPEGFTVRYQARSKNGAITNGGYSDYARQDVNTYPAEFWASASIGDIGGGQKQRMRLYLTNNDLQGSDYGYEQNGATTVRFGPNYSTNGTFMWNTTRHSVAWDSALCRDGLPCSGTPSKVSWGSRAGALDEIAAPGATYYYKVEAVGYNGWVRSANTGRITTPNDVPQHGKVIVTCAADNVIGSKLIDFNPRPRYGQWGYSVIAGLRAGYMGDRYTFDHYAHYWNGGAWNSYLSSSGGTGYYYGVSEGFDIVAYGDGGQSARIRQAVAALQPHTQGCAGPGARGDAMVEPTYPMYGYCGYGCLPNNSNRPQWSTR